MRYMYPENIIFLSERLRSGVGLNGKYKQKLREQGFVMINLTFVNWLDFSDFDRFYGKPSLQKSAYV